MKFIVPPPPPPPPHQSAASCDISGIKYCFTVEYEGRSMLLCFARCRAWSHVDSRWPSGEICGQLVDFLLAMDDTELLETARNLCQKRR